MNNVRKRGVFKISKLINNPMELILSASKDIISEEGISAISMRKIADRCNIGVGTIYNYYPTKMDIIVAVIEDFWKSCIINFRVNDIESVDFFEEIELFYFHILKYQEQFQGDFLKDLTALPPTNRILGKEKESKFMMNLLSIFEDIFNRHEDEFNPILFEYVSKNEVIRYISDYFMIMLKRNERHINLFMYTLRKLLL